MATRAQMRTPLRTSLRCSGARDAGGQAGESSGLSSSLCLLVSFMVHSRSGGSWAAGLSLRDCGWAAGADGTGERRRHPAVSGPAVPPLRLRPAGPLV